MSDDAPVLRAVPQNAPWNEILGWIDSEVAHAARRYALPANEREDMRQALCLRVLESLAGFDPANGTATFETWVRRHASWGVADYWRDRLRRERRETPVDGDALAPVAVGDAPPPMNAHRRELRAALKTCLSKLTPTQRERFLATEAAIGTREPLSSIAARFEISLDTLKETIARARVALRYCLQTAGFAPARSECATPPGAAQAV